MNEWLWMNEWMNKWIIIIWMNEWMNIDNK